MVKREQIKDNLSNHLKRQGLGQCNSKLSDKLKEVSAVLVGHEVWYRSWYNLGNEIRYHLRNNISENVND